MREASCNPLAFVLGRLKKQGLDLSRVTDGIPYTLDHILDKNERVEWTAFRQIWANIGTLVSDDEIILAGRRLLRSPMAVPFTVMARLLFTVRQVYLWIAAPHEGFGKQMITCISGKTRELNESRLLLEMRMDEGYEPCHEFFLFNLGSLIELSRVLGAGQAQVTMRELSNGADYDIQHGVGGGVLGRLWKMLTWPFTARRAARALEETHLALQSRYTDLESARDKLETQAEQLQLAYEIGQLVLQTLDVDAALNSITSAVVSRGRFRHARITLSRDSEGNPLAKECAAGDWRDSDSPLSMTLATTGIEFGTLELRADPSQIGTCEGLLGHISPIIQMALQNALAYRAVIDYRDNLALKVQERTQELEQARDKLTDALTQLKASQEVNQRFFSNVNHEIRTPLSLILLIASEIEASAATLSPEDEEVLRGRLDRIRSHTDSLLALVNDLLVLSSGQEGKLQIRRKNCDLRQLIGQVVSDWQSTADNVGVKLVTDLADIRGAVDPRAFARVLINLLSNAIKYTPSGGSVTVRSAATADGFTVEVSDTGKGIEAERLGSIFERYETSDSPVHRIKGSAGIGIGLPIVKELVEIHGGQVGVESTMGQGSTFKLRVPTVECDEPWDGRMATVRSLDVAPRPLVHKELRTSLQTRMTATVLVAEDEPELREAIVKIIGTEFNVISAPDGLEALALAEKHLPDVLVTDLGMPGMRGEELTRRFRGVVGNRLAPVIILSALAGMETRMTGFDAGAVDYIVKPFVPEDLLARIRAQLSLRHLALQLHEAEKVVSAGILTAGLAHELRNPANAIVNAIEPLRMILREENINDMEAITVLLNAIQTSADNMLVLCRDLLGFTERGEALKRVEPVMALVEASLLGAKNIVQRANVTVKLSYEGGVYCARALIVQALTNLIDNAAEAAGPGGRLEIRSQIDNGEVALTVLDSGPGVEPSLREKIFEPFFTTKEPGQGTGLGLSLCRAVVQNHGGSLKLVDAGDMHGFELRLPGGRADA